MSLRIVFTIKAFALSVLSVLFYGGLHAQVPNIISFTPTSATIGTTITITGTNFNTTAASNAVFFGGSRATVVSATVTSISVNVPLGAGSAPITVINTANGLSGSSTNIFNPTYSPNKGLVTAADFAPKVDFSTGAIDSYPSDMAFGDLDGDGRIDLLNTIRFTNSLSIFRNTSTGGTISFATRQNFSAGTRPLDVAVADLNGDGRLDVIVSNDLDNSISVFRNTSTVGNISFATRQDFLVGPGSAPWGLAVGDLNRDGKPEIAVCNSNANTISIFRNNSTSAAIALGTRQDVSVSSGPRSLVIADLTADGWPDLATITYNSNAISVLRSTSNTTTISFAALVDFATGGSFSQGIAAADLNGDGLPDLISGTNSSGGRIGVFRNTSISNSLSFAARQDFATTSAFPASITVGDADGDGLGDVMVAHSGGSLNDIAILRNASSGPTINFNTASTFAVSSVASDAIYDAALGDLSGDGKLDIAAVNWSLGAISILRNNPCFPTAGTIGNGHVIPNPAERSFDSLLNITLDQPLTFNGQTFGTYRWEQSTNRIDWVAAKTNTTAPSYRFDQDSLKQTTYYRRASNVCYGPTVYSNIDSIVVQRPNGILRGTVRSKNGNPVVGVNIEVQKTKSLPGSPESFIYRATTDSSGAYTVQPIFFGNENDGTTNTNFIIRPTNPGRFFNPVSSNRIFTYLDKDFRNVDFVDTTAFSVIGRVYQECANCLNVDNTEQSIIQGPLDGVPIFVDNSVTSSTTTGFITPPGQYGRYALTLVEPKVFKIEPKLTGRTFQPAFQNVNVTNNVSGIDFKDNTTFTISGKFSAGCGDTIGKARLEFYDVPPGYPTRPSVFRKWVWTNDTGFFSITLPARVYRVKVETFLPSSDVTTLDLNNFFNGLPPDSLTIDLTSGNRTFNLVYNRPPTIQITGLEPLCGLTTAVINQGAERLIPVKVWQGPIAKGCPAADSTLTIITNIQKDDTQETLNFRTTNGVAVVKLKGGTPNIAPPNFYKNLAVSFRDRGGRVATSSTNVVVAGLKQNAQTFSTVSPQIPLMVLHDPPGDLSKATWETSQTNETAMRIFAADAKEAELWSAVRLGQKWEAGTIFVNSEFNFWANIKGSVNVGANVINSSEAILSTTTTKSFSTADNPEVIGSEGDVFIGAALNFKYGIANEVYYDADSCKTGLRNRLLMANDGIATEFIFSDNHIRNTLIPNLISLRSFYANQPEKLDSLNNQIRVWEQVLANNEANKARAPLIKNISFDGSVGPVTETTTTSATRSSTLEFNMTIDRQVAIDAGFEIGGSGASTGGSVRFKTETGNSETNTSIKTTTFGFTLDDNDNGDYYSVNVKRDPVYNSPVFEMVAGRTSCPFEPGTQSRDEFAFTTQQPIVSGINPNSAAVFALNLTNLSPSAEARTFNVTLNQSTNPGFEVRINGTDNFPVAFPTTYQGTAPVTVSVRRLEGSNLFSFEGLQIVATDNCNGGISKTVSLSGFFTPTCSQAVIASPENGWLSNSGNNNIIPVIASGYNLANLNTLTLEYSRFGSNAWVPVASRTAEQLASTPSQTGFDWNTSSVGDGRYLLRLRINCTSGISYSQSVVGIIDRTPPIPVGKSEPVNDSWSIGSRIALVYNEPLDVANIDHNNIQLIRLSNRQSIPITVTGYDNEIIINPSVDLSSFQREVFRVRASNVRDYNGNSRTRVDSISFTVVPRVISNSPRAITLGIRNPTLPENVSGIAPGGASLQSDGSLKQLHPLSAGDTTISFYFTRPQNDTSIVRVNFTVSGTAVFGRDYLVRFDSVATDDRGVPSLGNTFNGTTGSIMIGRSTRTGILRIDPINNSIRNSSRSVIVTVIEGGDYDQGQTIVQQGTITNDDNTNVYEFIGTGLFTTNSNWKYNTVPPVVLPAGDTIIINPAATECILNVPLTLQNGSTLIVNPGKLLRERK